jgi:hypothetical protein
VKTLNCYRGTEKHKIKDDGVVTFGIDSYTNNVPTSLVICLLWQFVSSEQNVLNTLIIDNSCSNHV